jgi:hypothetical protein
MSKKREPSRWVLPLLLFMATGTGIGVGLIVSWVVWPVEYVDVAPDSLMPSHREEVLVLIGMSYAYNHDLGLAQNRLAALGDTTGSEVVTLAEKYASGGSNADQIRALTALAYALGFRRAALAPYMPDFAPTATWTPWPMPPQTFTPPPTETMTPSPTETMPPTPTVTASISLTSPVTPSTTLTTTVSPTPAATPTEAPTATPVPTLTPAPLPTPSPTTVPVSVPGFEIVKQQRVCDSPGGQLRVTVLDETGRPQPNVELLIRWDGQDEHFFTGLKPEKGIGYADFDMQKDRVYELVIVGAQSNVAQGLDTGGCENRLASWDIVFQFNRPDQ